MWITISYSNPHLYTSESHISITLLFL